MSGRHAFLAFLALTLVAPAQSVVFTTDTLIQNGDPTYEGYAVTVRGCTLTVHGSHTFQSLRLEVDATSKPAIVTHGIAVVNGSVEGFDLTINGSVEVTPTCRIDVSARGWPEGQGPGASPTNAGHSAGAGHGAVGGTSAAAAGGSAYDSLVEPRLHGSGAGTTGGWGPAGAGGGVVRIRAQGPIAVAGEILANGEVGPTGGGGSGGSIFLSCDTLSGAGAIAANGGATANTGYSGGGAGGRIALVYSTSTFTGAISAFGKSGKQYGGAGTIYTKKQADPFGRAVVDNGGLRGAFTPLRGSYWPVGTTYDLAVRNDGYCRVFEPLTFESMDLATRALVDSDVATKLDVTAKGNFTIDATSRVSTEALGFGEGQGPGASSTEAGRSAGAGHGGRGGTSYNAPLGGIGYDSIVAPSELGSGAGATGGWGASGLGGGAIRLRVQGALTVLGSIDSSGSLGPTGGGGSGGSVWITTATLHGSGSILANGGATSNTGYSGGGGGGRIALYYDASTFTGTVAARGGSGMRFGGAGTIFTKRTTDPYGKTLIENGGNRGVLTELRAAFWPVQQTFDLALADQGLAHIYGPLVFENLSLGNGAELAHDAGLATFDVTVHGNAVVDGTSAILADGLGHDEGAGPGASPTEAGHTAGASYGGKGGRSYYTLLGSSCYASVSEPVLLGSGAGATGGWGASGHGGGAIRLRVLGTLQLLGKVSARASDGPTGGGGSGGSIWITTGTLIGNGMVAADGGDTLNTGYSGGGGGGRIAIQYGTFAFAGLLSAKGGNGMERGGAGTIYLKRDLDPAGIVLVDNGGNTGAVTDLRRALWPTTATFDLVVRGRAIGLVMDYVEFKNLLLQDFGRMTHAPNVNAFDVDVWYNASIDATSAIDVDSCGGLEDQGPGASPIGSGRTGGAGHGGRGGDGYLRLGGSSYGNPEAPNLLGSGAGSTGGWGASGVGGGAVRLVVGGALQVEGEIRARGGVGPTGGGGSGGSLWLVAGTFAGNGLVTVDGGSTNNTSYSGGGAGGRIAVYSVVNSFTGTLSRNGGVGAANGQAGTLVVRNGFPAFRSRLRNGDLQAGVLDPWVASGGGASPAVEPFDVTGLGATLAFGVNAGPTPHVLEQTVWMNSDTTLWFAADLAGTNAGTIADPDAGQYEIWIAGVKVASGQLGAVQAGETKRRHPCGVFTPPTTGNQKLEIRIFRAGSASNVRTYVDNVELAPAAFPVSCVEDARRIGTTIQWNVRGIANAYFAIYISDTWNGSGYALPGFAGLFYLRLDSLVQLVGGQLNSLGAWSTPFPLPNDPALVGVPLWFQGVALEIAPARLTLGMLNSYPLIR